MNYFEKHIGDYLKDTVHLSLLEHGAYNRLLDVYYTTEKPLPSDVTAVQRLLNARGKDEKKAVTDVLAEFFFLGDDGWHQRRCDSDIAKFQEKSNKAKNSANARWAKEKGEAGTNENHANAYANASTGEHANASATAMRTHSEGNAPRARPQSPVTSHQSPEEKKARKRATPTPVIACPDGVEPQTWADWLALRKAKRAPVTTTVLDEAIREAGKARLTLDRFLRIWCIRGSQGLQADWIKPHELEPEWRRQEIERVRKAAPYAVAREPNPFTEDLIDGLPPA